MYKKTLTTINNIKTHFSNELCRTLNLQKVEAPLLLDRRNGLNDDLNGTETPVKVGEYYQVVQSLAKWKRYALYKYNFKEDEGLLTDMRALRPDEIRDPTHSMLVQQFDWCKIITREQYNKEYLETIVTNIYDILKRTEFIYADRPSILPSTIHFITAEELEKMYPTMTPTEREDAICQEYKAVFIRGIGGILPLSGEPHGGRSADYDNWIDQLNGDILVWNPVLNKSFEISSMGIRVDTDALIKQLFLHKKMYKTQLPFHQMVLNQMLPLTIGGGIGQDRLTMLLLDKKHIGKVQVSVWENDENAKFLL